VRTRLVRAAIPASNETTGVLAQHFHALLGRLPAREKGARRWRTARTRRIAYRSSATGPCVGRSHNSSPTRWQPVHTPCPEHCTGPIWSGSPNCGPTTAESL